MFDAFTVKLTVAVCEETPPDDARTTIGVVAAEADADIDSVSVDVVTGAANVVGLKLAVTPVGRPSAANATLPTVPIRVIVTGTETLVPCAVLAVPEPTASVNADAGAADTVNVYGTV